MSSKVVLISGGTSGIGLACAGELLARQWRVVIVGRDQEKGRRAREILAAPEETLLFLPGDVSQETECQSVVEQTIAAFGRLDGLVTSAGQYAEALLDDVSAPEVQHLFAVNVFGTVFLCKKALPYLKRTKGSIVTVGSDAGLQGNVACSIYCATKGAVVAFSRSLALETAPHGVRVNCVCPGDVLTPLLERQLAADSSLTVASMKEQYPLYRLAEPQEIAKSIAFLLSDDASFITAVALPVDGGLTSW
jgi:NAD(P)-dependent dehydrogenase (short-subunit alcohol dehydrogenase family)